MSGESGQTVVTVLIIVLVVIILAAVAYLVYRFVRKSKDPGYADKLRRNKEYRAELSPHKAALKGAQKEYDARIDARNEAVRAAKSEHDKAVSAQEREIKNIENSLNVHIASFGSVKLYRDHVEHRGKTIRLTPSTSARVLSSDEFMEFQQKVQADAQAAAQLEDINAQVPVAEGAGQPAADVDQAIEPNAGGEAVVQAPVQVTQSFAYLVIDDASSAASKLEMEVDESNCDQAKSFATTLNCAAADVDGLRAQRAQQLEEARQKLADIKKDTAAIDAAQEALRAEARNREALDNAQRAFDEAKYEAKKKRDGL